MRERKRERERKMRQRENKRESEKREREKRKKEKKRERKKGKTHTFSKEKKIQYLKELPSRLLLRPFHLRHVPLLPGVHHGLPDQRVLGLGTLEVVAGYLLVLFEVSEKGFVR